MNKHINTIIQLITLALVGVMVFSPASLSFGGTTNYDQLDTTDGYSVDGTSIIDGSGAFTGTVSGTINTSNAITYGNCTTATYNPPAFSSSTDATTTIALPTASVGDFVFATFDSATSTEDWYVTANLKSAGTVASGTIALHAIVGSPAYVSGLNITTSTLTACVIK